VKSIGEACDGDDFGGKTCNDYGFNSGMLVCSNCVVKTGGCWNDLNPEVGDAGTCTQEPAGNWYPGSTSIGIDIQSPEMNILGTGGRFGINMSTTAAAEVKGTCKSSFSQSGGFSICGSIANHETCADFAVSATSECEYAKACTHPPQFECRDDLYCCSESVAVSGTQTKSIEFPNRANVLPMPGFKLGCKGTISASFGVELSASIEKGPICECPGGELAVPNLTGTFGGGGAVDCGITLFDQDIGSIGASAGVCFAGSLSGTNSCGVLPTPSGGAAIGVCLPNVKLGWWVVNAFCKDWKGGDGCEVPYP